MDCISCVKKHMYCISEIYVTSSLEVQENPIYACLGCFIFILSSPDIYRMIEVKKSGERAVVITSLAEFLIKKRVFAFAELFARVEKQFSSHG